MPALAVGAALVALAPEAARLGRTLDSRLPRWLSEAWPFWLVFGATCWLYWGLVAGNAPGTWDHNFHVLKALETEKLLRRGSLFGWSDAEYAGFPHNVMYPFAGSMLTAALHALPGVDLPRAYAWSVLLSVLSVTCGVYFAARLHFGRAAGVVAGLLALFDPGDWWRGGHISAVDIGMWVQSLALGLLLPALALIPWVLETGTWRRLLPVGGLIGLAVLFHPQTLVLLCGAFVPMAVAAIGGLPQVPVKQLLGRAVLLGSVAFIACAFWLVPYVAAKPFFGLPYFGPSLTSWTWKELVKGDLFCIPAMWMGVCLYGLVALLRGRSIFGRFIALAVPVMMLCFTDEALRALHVRSDAPHANEFTDELQLARLYFLIRPLAMIAAGVVVARVGGQVLRSRQWRGGRSVALRGLLVGMWLLVPIAGTTIPGAPETPVPPGLSPEDRDDLSRALDAARPLVGPAQRLVLFTPGEMDHNMVGLAAMHGFDIHLIGQDAAAMFKNRFSTQHPTLLARIGAAAIVSRGPPPAALGGVELVGTFGPFEVRRLTPQPRAWMEGPGRAEVLSWTEQEIRVRVTGVPRGGPLRLGMGHYDRWIDQDQQAVAPFKFLGATLATAWVKDGETVITYRAPRAQWIGAAITFAGWLALAIAVGWRLRQRRPQAPSQPVVQAVAT